MTYRREKGMQINPYLTFNGNCREAFEFYATVLNGTIDAFITHDDMPEAGIPADDPTWGDKIMHAHMTIGDRTLMGSDAPAGYYSSPAGMHVHLGPSSLEEAERVWSQLSEGATVFMPLDKTPWAERFGMLIDRFGTPWIINYDKESM